ncbi:LysM peptidoglycan-binding domain-containing protein [Virgibacillus dakarensis]|nr:LysM peptidoglycan-binding domain-containing protein [Virgibacillus dakarensis]
MLLYHFYRQCPENHYPYVIQPGDTLNFIANRLEVVVSRIVAANPGIDPYNLRVGQTICIPACPPNHFAYIIQPGDTLYRISQTFNVTISSILEANPSIDPNSLRVAQRICIPSACALVNPNN